MFWSTLKILGIYAYQLCSPAAIMFASGETLSIYCAYVHNLCIYAYELCSRAANMFAGGKTLFI